MTLEEFIAQGEADSLTDGNLRDLWLIYGDPILEQRPTSELSLRQGTSWAASTASSIGGAE